MTWHADRKSILIAIIGAGLICFAALLIRIPRHHFTIITYMNNGKTLRTGATVWLDGIKAGSVTMINVRPELKEGPVEIFMAIDTPYQLSIPLDSTASLRTEGVLEPAGIEIDTRKTTLPLIKDGGTLQSREVQDSEAAQAIERIGKALIDASKQNTEKAK
jgi:ABC-type transporter Mla subunit MlaD